MQYYSGFRENKEELEQISLLLASSKVKIYILLIVLVLLKPTKFQKLHNLSKNYWSGPIGIHAHDNKGLALSNTMEAIKCGTNWLDSTITGIRRPGILKLKNL